MKLNTGINSAFPSQMVSEEEKRTLDYGLLVGQAIEYEWFRGGAGCCFTSYIKNRPDLTTRGQNPIAFSQFLSLGANSNIYRASQLKQWQQRPSGHAASLKGKPRFFVPK